MPRYVDVTTPDGLTLATCEWGKADGPPIVFIHGYSQCHLAWAKQMADPGLGDEFRCIAYDLRGHGASDKPVEKKHYGEDKLWADDLAAVLAATQVERPVLVAWSYAGRVVADYVRSYGVRGIAAVNFVAAVTKSDKAFMGPSMKLAGRMTSDVLAENIAATTAFVHACFERPPGRAELETILAYNMVMPARVRAAVLARTPNRGDTLALMEMPVLVTHGTKDTVVLPEGARWTAAAAPNATLSLYDGVGHSPFMEDAPRFNRELIELARRAQEC